ncbi:hypothetical protein FHX52_2527 [Humibacillus xanthopallidus]|uniref:Uncharacterized protein n=1 Tax=Humibacillus xanthopallidus TaxID=412689 RepID=A0A543PP66_9MICO|nr:hypothetical protein FHX52_2527 [Humibacillus xanthopallidus]
MLQENAAGHRERQSALTAYDRETAGLQDVDRDRVGWAQRDAVVVGVEVVRVGGAGSA